MPGRRFPLPWSVEDIGAAFVVKDSAGQKLGYFSVRTAAHVTRPLIKKATGSTAAFSRL